MVIMDVNEELRNKRLNYYNKVLSVSTSKFEPPTADDLKSEKKKNVLFSSTKNLNFNTNNKKSLRESADLKPVNASVDSKVSRQSVNKNDFLDRVFGVVDASASQDYEQTNARPKAVTAEKDEKQPPKFNQSLSFEERSLNEFNLFSTPSANRKLEEFKRVVESSYEKHVLTKLDLSSNRSNANVNSNTTLANHDQLNSIFRPDEENHNQIPTSNGSRFDDGSFIHAGSKTLPCKVPYMSAYNIYNQNGEESYSVASSARANVAEPINRFFLDLNNNKLNDLAKERNVLENGNNNNNKNITNKSQKLTSNGSSLTTSPTSVSSNESRHKDINLAAAALVTSQHKPVVMHEIKPPDMPKPQSTFLNNRINRLNRLNNQPQLSSRKSNNDLFDSLESTKAIIDFENKQTTPDKTPVVERKPSPATQQTTIQPQQQPIKPHASQLEPQPDLNEQNNDHHHDHDHDDDDSDTGSDTFDIFSSHESLVDRPAGNTGTQPLPLNLNIDLSDINKSDSEHEDLIPDDKTYTVGVKHVQLNDDEPKFSASSSANSTTRRQQIKPDNIPNLALDQMDDDKSISVTVSLAKSMCKEINYKKEMEALVLNGIMPKSPSRPMNKPVVSASTTGKLKPINYLTYKKFKNELKLSNGSSAAPSSSSSSSTNPKTKQEKPESVKSSARDSYFANAFLSSRPQTAKHQQQQPTSQNTTARPKSGLDIRQRPATASKSGPVPKSQNQMIKSVQLLDKKPSTNANTQNQTMAKKNSSPSNKREETQAKERAASVSKKVIWASSLAVVRSSSANSIHRQSVKIQQTPNVDHQTDQKPPLFLDYSKLIAIEMNMTNNNNDTFNNKLKSSSTSGFIEHPNDYRPFNETSYVKLEPLNNKTDNGPVTQANICQDSVWMSLPDEIWLKILTFMKHADLARFGQVCKKFHRLYKDNTLWRKIVIKYQYEIRDEWLIWIGKRRPDELNIVQCSGNVSLPAISEMFKTIGDQLKSLNLSRCSNGSLSGDNFALQASIRCQNVTNLDLSWTLLSNQTLILIVDSFKRIETINLSGCNMIKEDGFNSLLVRHGEHLKNIEISGCLHFSSNCILNIGVYCRDLERLNISNCHRMTNESLMEACEFWKKLKFIDFRGIKSVKNNCISLIVRKCVSLEGIAFGECVNLGDASILEIATYKSNIKHLDANGCKKITDKSLRSLATFCSKLEFLNLKGTNITDEGLVTMTNGKCLTSLCELNLSYLPVSEPILVNLIKNCEKIRKVHLYGCYNIKNMENIVRAIGEKAYHLEINI